MTDNDPASLALEKHVLDFMNEFLGLQNVSSVQRPPGSNLDVLGDKGLCNLVTLNLFTGIQDGNPQRRYLYGPGYEMAFATMLAIKHLNEGDDSIVPELRQLNETCPIRFLPEYHDTGELEPARALSVVQEVLGRQGATRSAADTCPVESVMTQLPPCAFIGAHESSISALTSPLTGLAGYPQVSGTSAQDMLDDKLFFPKFARTIPSQAGAAVALVEFLLRDDVFRKDLPYLAILHVDDDYGNSYVSRIRDYLKHYNDNQTEIAASTRQPPNIVYMENLPLHPSGRNIESVVQKLKNLGFRTVFAILKGSLDFHNAVVLQAYRQGTIGTGKEVWYFSDDSIVPITANQIWPTNSSLDVAYRGSGVIWPGTGDVDELYLKFVQGLQQLKNSPAIMDFMKAALPRTEGINETQINNGLENLFFLNPLSMDPRAQFVYEATVLLGLAACQAVTDDLFLDGDEFFDQLLATDFHGVSGHIVLDQSTGTRASNSTFYAILNMIENEDPESQQIIAIVPTHVFENEWSSFSNNSFVYNDRTLVRPGPEGDFYQWQRTLSPETVYVNDGIKVVACVLCALSIVLALSFIAWTVFKWNTRIVGASQPLFLIIICFGCIVLVSMIIPLVLDLSILSLGGVSSSCTATVWLLSLGMAIIFSALASKTHRINKIMRKANRFQRIKVSVKETLLPVIVAVIVNIITLGIMTALKPVPYELTPTSWDQYGRATEYRGYCQYYGRPEYLISLALINAGILLLAIAENWQARHLSTEFQESKGIFRALFSILLVLFVGIPALFLVKGNPDATVFVASALLFVFGTSILLCLFVPKMLYEKERKRGDGRVKVSGLNEEDPKPTPGNSMAGNVSQFTHCEGSSSGEEIFSYKSRHDLAIENAALKKQIQELEDNP